MMPAVDNDCFESKCDFCNCNTEPVIHYEVLRLNWASLICASCYTKLSFAIAQDREPAFAECVKCESSLVS